MATKKRVKRFAEAAFVDQDLADQEATSSMRGIPDQTEEEAANEAAMTMRQRAMTEGDRDEKAMATPATRSLKVEAEAPAKARMQSGPGRKPSTPAAKPAVKSAPSGISSTGAGLRAMENAMAAKAAKAPEEKRYRGYTDSERTANRAKAGDMLSSAASSVGDYIRGLGKRGGEEKQGTYRDSSGKVVKYASGGSVSASRRADGIATKGKTRGKIC